VNSQQRRRFIGKLVQGLGGSLDGRRVAILGLAFKPFTDDMRQAPAVDVIRQLEELGAGIVATDPAAVERARSLLPRTTLVDDPYVAVTGVDAVGVVTEWPEYRGLAWERALRLMRGRLVVDGRNCLDGEVIAGAGGVYVSMGRRPRGLAPAPPAELAELIAPDAIPPLAPG